MMKPLLTTILTSVLLVSTAWAQGTMDGPAACVTQNNGDNDKIQACIKALNVNVLNPAQTTCDAQDKSLSAEAQAWKKDCNDAKLSCPNALVQCEAAAKNSEDADGNIPGLSTFQAMNPAFSMLNGQPSLTSGMSSGLNLNYSGGGNTKSCSDSTEAAAENARDKANGAQDDLIKSQQDYSDLLTKNKQAQLDSQQRLQDSQLKYVQSMAAASANAIQAEQKVRQSLQDIQKYAQDDATQIGAANDAIASAQQDALMKMQTPADNGNGSASLSASLDKVVCQGKVLQFLKQNFAPNNNGGTTNNVQIQASQLKSAELSILTDCLNARSSARGTIVAEMNMKINDAKRKIQSAQLDLQQKQQQYSQISTDDANMKKVQGSADSANQTNMQSTQMNLLQQAINQQNDANRAMGIMTQKIQALNSRYSSAQQIADKTAGALGTGATGTWSSAYTDYSTYESDLVNFQSGTCCSSSAKLVTIPASCGITPDKEAAGDAKATR